MSYHLITSEYPPQAGGVSDYTRQVAMGLAQAGEEVHVWCPSVKRSAGAGGGHEVELADATGVFVHRELGRFAPGDLRRAGSLLDQFSGPRRLLVQWVPHGYGYQSMNLPFCLWLRSRALRQRDLVEVMVHEPYLAFGEGSLKQSGVAAVHRLMTIVLLNSARRVWMAIPAWEGRWRPYALGRRLPFSWLPVTSNIPLVDDPASVQVIRARYAPAGEQLIGHFGAYDYHVNKILLQTAPTLLRSRPDCVLLLLGRGSEALRDELIAQAGELAGRIRATGQLAAPELSLHLSACDVMLQPYIDGVSSRRCSLLAGLSHGLPLVTTNGRLTESLWAESRAVALVPAEDAAQLVSATLSLLADDAERQRLSTAARRLYAERFDVKLTITALRAEALA